MTPKQIEQIQKRAASIPDPPGPILFAGDRKLSNDDWEHIEVWLDSYLEDPDSVSWDERRRKKRIGLPRDVVFENGYIRIGLQMKSMTWGVMPDLDELEERMDYLGLDIGDGLDIKISESQGLILDANGIPQYFDATRAKELYSFISQVVDLVLSDTDILLLETNDYLDANGYEGFDEKGLSEDLDELGSMVSSIMEYLGYEWI